MRIIAGRYRGHRLAALGKGDTAARLRPTPDRVRESLFSMLTHLDALEESRVLDLFAGTGALGLEALSRGAAHVSFVENGRTGQRLISENIQKLGVGAQASLLRADATRLGPHDGTPFDLVFMDPPYGKGLGEKALAAAWAGGWIAKGAIVVWEESLPISAPVGFDQLNTRRFGDTTLTLMKCSAVTEGE